eukprot:15453052-Alexandrium_andersonii.AAC.2
MQFDPENKNMAWLKPWENELRVCKSNLVKGKDVFVKDIQGLQIEPDMKTEATKYVSAAQHLYSLIEPVHSSVLKASAALSSSG